MPALTEALAIPVETLLEQNHLKRGPTPKLLQQMERIHRLPKAKQRFVMQMIDTIVEQQDRQSN